MKSRSLLALALVVGAALAAALCIWYPRLAIPTDARTLVISEVLSGAGVPHGITFLLSGSDGYGIADAIAARRIALAGSIVVAIDTPATLALANDATGNGDCTYFVADIEQASQDLQRSLDLARYHSPVIAGAGLGATFALALAAQTPDATIERTIAIDPGAELPMTRELCTGAPHNKSADGKGWIYGLQPQALPDPVTVIDTPAADGKGIEHVGELIAEGFAITRSSSRNTQRSALLAAVIADLGLVDSSDNPLADLPITPLPGAARMDTMAIILSGDGGWRDIDAEIGDFLSKGGVPVVGLDSLRYFWSKREPEQTAADIARIIDVYTRKWKVGHVALIGYSFGADLLPAVWRALPAESRSRVSLVSLLAYSGARQFEIQVSGILGGSSDPDGPSTIADLRAMPAGLAQCLYGTEDEESACLRLNAPGVELVSRPGGHHFDDDYQPIAEILLGSIDRRRALATAG